MSNLCVEWFLELRVVKILAQVLAGFIEFLGMDKRTDISRLGTEEKGRSDQWHKRVKIVQTIRFTKRISE